MSKHYIIIVNMPGWLPEAEPYVFECDDASAPVPQVLQHIYSEVDEMADEASGDYGSLDNAIQDGMDDRTTAEAVRKWCAVLEEIERDRDNAADFSEDGFIYNLPDGYVIEATLKTRDELIADGWLRGVDFSDPLTNS